MIRRSDIKLKTIKKIVTHPKFSPDLFDYDIFLDLSILLNGNRIQAGLSEYFYKRWLIASVLQSVDVVQDCINKIINPYKNNLKIPYNYTKYLLHQGLYPNIKFEHDKIVQIVVDSTIKIDVKDTDNPCLYLFKNKYLTHFSSADDCCYYIGKRGGDKILDLNDDDLLLLRENNRGMLLSDDVGYIG